MSVCYDITWHTIFFWCRYSWLTLHCWLCFVVCVAKYVEHFMHKCLLWFHLTHKRFSILNLCFPLCVVLLKEIYKWPLKNPLNFKFYTTLFYLLSFKNLNVLKKKQSQKLWTYWVRNKISFPEMQFIYSF